MWKGDGNKDELLILSSSSENKNFIVILFRMFILFLKGHSYLLVSTLPHHLVNIVNVRQLRKI
jgi:hypothetical protein